MAVAVEEKGIAIQAPVVGGARSLSRAEQARIRYLASQPEGDLVKTMMAEEELNRMQMATTFELGVMAFQRTRELMGPEFDKLDIVQQFEQAKQLTRDVSDIRNIVEASVSKSAREDATQKILSKLPDVMNKRYFLGLDVLRPSRAMSDVYEQYSRALAAQMANDTPGLLEGAAKLTQMAVSRADGLEAEERARLVTQGNAMVNEHDRQVAAARRRGMGAATWIGNIGEALFNNESGLVVSALGTLGVAFRRNLDELSGSTVAGWTVGAAVGIVGTAVALRLGGAELNLPEAAQATGLVVIGLATGAVGGAIGRAVGNMELPRMPQRAGSSAAGADSEDI